MGSRRPVKITRIAILHSGLNQVLDTVVVVPLSTKPGEIWPLRVALQTAVSPKESFAIVPGIRQIAKSRIFKAGAVLPEHLLGRLSTAVTKYLTD